MSFFILVIVIPWLASLPSLLLGLLFIRIVRTWVTNSAQGSGITGILLHASSNAVSMALIASMLPTPIPDQVALAALSLLGFLLLLSVVLLVTTRGRLSYTVR